MSLSALFCVDHFYGTDQNCFQDLGGNGLNQMGCKTSAFTFSHIQGFLYAAGNLRPTAVRPKKQFHTPPCIIVIFD
jgi:hypothetical protein